MQIFLSVFSFFRYILTYFDIFFRFIFNVVRVNFFVTGTKILQQINENSSLQLYGERVTVEKMSPTKQLQLICTSTNPSATIEVDMLKSYFSNPASTGISRPSSLQSVDILETSSDKPVYLVTYSSQQGELNSITS